MADICVKNEIIDLSDEVYDRLYYVPFTRIATLSPEIERLTLTVGSAGKNFYATGWRVGMYIQGGRKTKKKKKKKRKNGRKSWRTKNRS